MSDYTEIQSQFYSDMVERTADALTRLAEDVRRYAKVDRDPMFHKDNPHVYNAKDLIHRVSWGMANLNLEGILARALDADEALLIKAKETR